MGRVLPWIDFATFRIHESYADEAMLQVVLFPETGSAAKGQVFFVGLKRYGSERRWGVYYWAPRAGGTRPAMERG